MKDNKLIAEFMQKSSEGFGLYDYNGKHYKLDELKFHSSWDWLMPVLKKINLQLNPDNYNDWRMINRPTEYDIKEVHSQAVGFIKGEGVVDIHAPAYAQYSLYIERCVSDEVEGEILSFKEWKQLNN